MGKRLYNNWVQTARANADKVVVRDYARQCELSFGELAEKVESGISNLCGTDLKNRLVLLQIPNSGLWLEAFLICQAMGAIAVPVDPDIPAEGIRRLCRHLRPSALWSSEGINTFHGAVRLRPACLVKLTSGSTGEPRPLVFSDQEMLADGKNIISTMGITPNDRNLAIIPFGHSYGLGNLVLPLIIQGTPLVIPSDPYPFSLSEAVGDSRATVFPGVPTLLNSLARAGIPRRSMASIRLVISAGSPLGGEQAGAFRESFGKVVHNFYGSSETGGIAFDRSGLDTLSGRSVGKPMENVAVESSRSGRLRVRSKAVYRRNNRLAGTSEAAFLLPDLAVVLEDGSISLIGRKTRQIKLAGKRLNLAEVENILREQTGVMEAFVESYKDNRGRTRLGVAIVSSQSSAALKDVLKEKLPSWKIPKQWIELDKFPITARGKPDYRALSRLIRKQFESPESG